MPSGMLPPLIAELRARSGQFTSELGAAKAEAGKMMSDVEASGSKMAASAKASFGALASVGKAAALGIAGGGLAIGAVSIKMAGDFQAGMTTLVTGAGEAESNMGTVSAGVLKMAGQLGQTTQQLTSGLYLIESAGFHGAAGLNVLKAAGEGAKVGNADMGTVADGLTTALHDYGISADQAATVTSKLVTTVASGKTTMGDLSGALATILPTASAAKVSLDQVLGAMATMTAGGTPAADAATYLKQTIAQLSNPTSKAAGEMKALGLNAIDISSNLGTRGLTGTLTVLTDAIQAKMGPAGTVLIQQMTTAAKSGKDMGAVIAALPPTQQTYIAALADMVGGTKSMQAALELTGSNMATFQTNVKTIGAASTEAGGNVQGWSLVQKDFNTQLDQAKGTVEALGIRLGTVLIPKLMEAVKATQQIVVWFSKHKDAAIALGVVVGGVLTAAITAYVASLVVAGVKSVTEFAKMSKSALEWVGKQAGALATWVAESATAVASWVATQAAAFGTWVAESAVSVASWVATQAAAFASSVAAGAVWIAEHAAMAAGYIASNVAMAASATAAFIAENAATLGIGAAIAALVVGIVYLATHWKQVWGDIKAIALDAWHFIDDILHNKFVQIALAFVAPWIDVAMHWKTVWADVKAAASEAWAFIKMIVIDPIKLEFGLVEAAARDLLAGMQTVWSGIKTAISDVWSIIKPILDTMQKAIGDTVGAVGKVAGLAGKIGGGIGHAAGDVGKVFGFATGGVVPGPIGAPMLAVVHGGETVIPPSLIASGGNASAGLGRGGSGASGVGLHVHVHMDGTFVGGSPTDGAALAQHIFDHVVTIAQQQSRRNGFSGLAGVGI